MNTMLDDKQKAAMDAGVRFGMQMLKQLPKGDRLALETHMTGVLIAFWGALWGTFGTEYAGASSRNNCAAWNPTYRMRGSGTRVQ